MANALIVEEEVGRCRGWIHPHNGYYAGSFSQAEVTCVERGSTRRRHLFAVDSQRHTLRDALTFDWPDAA